LNSQPLGQSGSNTMLRNSHYKCSKWEQ